MITFQYPGYNPTVTISLPSPERGDDEVDLSELFIHRTEGGQYKSNIKASCTEEYERPLVFIGLCKAQIDELLAFIADSLGQYIKYTDYNGTPLITQITDEVLNINETPAGYEVEMTLLMWEA
jgi:hypothetical protein